MEWFEWWEVREKELFDKIVLDLNAVTNTPFGPWKNTNNCFVGEAPPRVNTWHLVMGDGDQEQVTFKPRVPDEDGRSITELQMDVDIGGWFTERKAGQRLGMMILSFMNYQAAQIPGFQIVRMRRNGTPSCEKQKVDIYKESKPRTINVLALGLECVFDTPDP